MYNRELVNYQTPRLAPPHTPHLHGPVWQGAGQRWLPQRSLRLHVSSQAAWLPSQQRRLQGWRPQALVALQRRSHSTSWWHCTARLVWPQRQVLVTVSRHTWVCVGVWGEGGDIVLRTWSMPWHTVAINLQLCSMQHKAPSCFRRSAQGNLQQLSACVPEASPSIPSCPRHPPQGRAQCGSAPRSCVRHRTAACRRWSRKRGRPGRRGGPGRASCHRGRCGRLGAAYGTTTVSAMHLDARVQIV
jgi:hypothetical protein